MSKPGEHCWENESTLIGALATSVLVVNPGLNIIQVNSAAESLLEQSATKLVGRQLHEVIAGGCEFIQIIVRAFAEGRRSFTERDMALTPLNMHPIVVDFTVSPWVTSSDGDAKAVIEIANVERHQRIQLEENMVRQNHVTSALMRGLAHEVKNPLGGIRGAAQLLEREFEDQRRAEYTQIIIGEVDRLRTLVDKMLGPRERSEVDWVNIHEVLEQVSQLVEAEHTGAIKIVRDYDPSLPEIKGDCDRLIQAFLNLVRNAVRAVDGIDATITVRSRADRNFTIGDKVHALVMRIDIIDTGGGVAPEIFESIFSPMVSGHADGSGLGLPLAQSMINGHGGLIGFKSEPGHTEFTVWLPIGRKMTHQHEVWIVDDDHAIRWVLERALAQVEIKTRSFDEADKVIARLRNVEPDAIVTDIRMPGTDGMALLEHVNQNYPDLPVIIMTAYADLDRAVAVFQGGAFEYLPKPFDVDDAVAIVSRAVKNAPQLQTVDEPLTASGTDATLIGSAPAMQEVFRAIGRLSKSNMTVLLTGESGTGKELVAQALHRHSPRRDGPFVAINTAAIPSELLESELFGHEKGAFTGATGQRLGRFEQANSGTLFLDEIGDMPSALQTRFLRVLADGEFYRVGGHQSVKVDVRVIAATHQNLDVRVNEGSFREDLYHRLNVIRLHLPALRERVEDVSELADHFLKTTAQELDIEAKRLRPAALDLLSRYQWPGNVRQLENVCRRATIMAPAQEIDVEDLPGELRMIDDTQVSTPGEDWKATLKKWAERLVVSTTTPILDEAVPRFERIMIRVALAQTRGRRQDAARLLGWGRNTLTRKIKELDLEV